MTVVKTVHRDGLNERTNRQVFSRVTLVGFLCVCLLLAGSVAALRYRGHLQQVRVAEMLKYDASIHAQYGAYKYVPPTRIQLGNNLELVLGRGQRLMGYSVIDEPTLWIGWLAAIVGDHALTQATDVYIGDDRFSDANVHLLLAFSDLRAIDVSDTQITDAGVSKLAALEQLVILDLSDTDISAKGLRNLGKCKSLKELDISGTNADDEVVEFLRTQLPQCQIEW